MANKVTYDYIIAGAGCAGLSLLVHMINSGQFTDKKILLVDKGPKNTNDHTWCFWEEEQGPFEDIVTQRWEQAWFHHTDFSRLLPLSPYTYKMIRAIDFYNYCFDLIGRQSNIDILYGDVQRVESNEQGTFVEMNGETIFSRYIFNSILFGKPALRKKDYYLLQHFKGWVIDTKKPLFKMQNATLMDFRTEQRQGTTFVYVMPLSPTTALVEYTLFTANLIDAGEYDEGLRQYIAQFITPDYIITEEEYGVIPMTNHRFPVQQHNIIYIGTAGGQTKASSGYTFRFIQKHSAALVKKLIETDKPFGVAPSKKRFRFYDSVLLHVLQHQKVAGDKIFTRLFSKNKPRQVLRFLDNESSIKDELQIISSLPAWPFLKAALQQV